MKPQTKEVLTMLNERGSLTPKEARTIGCDRLAARVYELRHKHGVPVEKRLETAPNGGRYARYILTQPELFV